MVASIATALGHARAQRQICVGSPARAAGESLDDLQLTELPTPWVKRFQQACPEVAEGDVAASAAD